MCSLTGCEQELEHMLTATADDQMRESEISELAYVSVSEVGFGSTVARLSKESGCAIAREAWEGMEHLIHRRRQGTAHGFSSQAPTFGIHLLSAPLLGSRCRLKPYTKDNAVGVGFQVRKHGVDGRRRERGRNTRILSVLFTLDTDSPTRLHHPE